MRALSRLADVAGFWTLDRTTITGRSAVILRQQAVEHYEITRYGRLNRHNPLNAVARMSPRTTSGKAWPPIVLSNPGYSSRCTAECNIGNYARSFSLSSRFDQNKIGAELKDGVL
jgi:hypothetical protein